MEILWSDRKRTIFGLPLSFTKYTLTAERLFIERGFLNKREDEIRLYRVMDLSMTTSLTQRMFGVGTIHLCTADKTLGDFDILNIKDAHDVKEVLSEQIEKERAAKRVSTREYMTHDEDDDDDGIHE